MKSTGFAFTLGGSCLLSILSGAQAVTLEKLLQTTLDKNPAIAQAKANLEEAAGDRLILRSIMWPDAKVASTRWRSRWPSRRRKRYATVYLRARIFHSALVQCGGAAVAPARRCRSSNRGAATEHCRGGTASCGAAGFLYGAL